MKTKLFCVAVFVTLAIFSSVVKAQNDEKPLLLKGRTELVTGEIGGESQDKYVINLPAQRKFTITLQSPRNNADFSLCDENGRFGQTDRCEQSKSIVLKSRKYRSRKIKRWTGIIPQNGKYIISVTAYPDSAKYTLKVSLDR